MRVLEVVMSGLGALFGVQSSKAYHRDAEQKSPWAYIGMGILLTVIFICTLLGIVQWVLSGTR